jgi:uncharacterized protein (DUF885 family)
VTGTYLPAANRPIAASSLPDGEAYYAHCAREHTTSVLSPAEIHQTGLNEVARLREAMNSIIQDVGFEGSLEEFASFLRFDHRFYFTKAEDLVTAYRDTAKRPDAEHLGLAMGFYADPYSKFGQLTYEMWRACRLVVDTGLHQFGWTRQQAIEYIQMNTAKTVQDIAVEVDRYIVWPGQALAYKIGELKIKELRAKAERELRSRFDLRSFHNALLDDGPLPIALLELQIGEWQRKASGGS